MRYVIEEIKPGAYVLSFRDTDVKFFEASREIGHEGILYNAYLIVTDDGAILIDGRKREYEKEFLEALDKILKGKPIKAYIVNHSEPDHSGTLPAVVKRYNPKIYGNAFAMRLLKAFYGKEVSIDFQPVKDEEEIEILGKRVKFFHTTLLHRPDTILTLIDGILFTGDILGSYYAFQHPIYSERKEPDPDTGELRDIKEIFMEEAAEYFSTVIGSFRRHGSKFLSKVKKSEYDVLAPAHGLVRTKDLDYPIEIYRKLIEGEPLVDGVLLLYSSMYGITMPAVEAAKKAIEDKGYEPLVFGFTDKEASRIPDILGNTYLAKKIVIVSSAYEGELHPRMRLSLELMAKKAPEREMLIFMPFGRGAAFPRDVQEKLEKRGFKLTIERLSVSALDAQKIYSKTLEFLE